MGLLIHPGERIVTDYWDDHHIQWHRSHSHNEKVVPPVVGDAILRLSHGLLKRGVKKMHATLLLHEYDTVGPVSVTDIQTIFKRHNLWTGERKPKVKVPQRCRYEGDYLNLIWHIDLHHGDWIIGWIDDRSRMCLGFRFLPNKISAEIAKALSELLEHYPVPSSKWTDNGKEFEGVFRVVLQKQGIQHNIRRPITASRTGSVNAFGALLKWRRRQKMSPISWPNISEPRISGSVRFNGHEEGDT
jgi:hypothetical protein